MPEQVLIHKDKQKAKQLTAEMKKFEQFCNEVSKQLNGMVKDVASKQWAMGKILVTNKVKAEKEFGKNLMPLYYMGVARASGQDLSPTTIKNYALFYETIPDLDKRLARHSLPVKFYWIITSNVRLHDKINELEKQWLGGEWNTVKEFYGWVYPEKELTPIDMAQRFHTSFASWRSNIDQFVEMNVGELDSVEAEGLQTDIAVTLFESFPRLAKEIYEQTGAKPDQRILKLLKMRE